MTSANHTSVNAQACPWKHVCSEAAQLNKEMDEAIADLAEMRNTVAGRVIDDQAPLLQKYSEEPSFSGVDGNDSSQASFTCVRRTGGTYSDVLRRYEKQEEENATNDEKAQTESVYSDILQRLQEQDSSGKRPTMKLNGSGEAPTRRRVLRRKSADDKNRDITVEVESDKMLAKASVASQVQASVTWSGTSTCANDAALTKCKRGEVRHGRRANTARNCSTKQPSHSVFDWQPPVAVGSRRALLGAYRRNQRNGQKACKTWCSLSAADQYV